MIHFFKHLVFSALLVCAFVLFAACKDEFSSETEIMKQEKIKVLMTSKISVGSEVFEVVYYDNPTAKSLTDQFPLTVELEDYAGMEKIFYPEVSLSNESAPEGAKPSKGDVMYYAPWGDVAIFYKDFRYAAGLITLGHITDIDGLISALLSSQKVTFHKN